MSIEHNKQVVRRLFDEVFNQGNLLVIDDIIAVDALGHDATSSEPRRGIESIRQVAVSFRNAFPDGEYFLDDLVAEGDRVVARWRLVGHHQGVFMGVPPTGREVEVSGIIIYRLADRKIAEYWGVFDTLALMRQIGAMAE
jgi:steroid delta-isomerase-like uncharacterized protein